MAPLMVAAICAACLPSASAAAGAPPLPAQSRAGQWIVDAQGRVIVMHGVDLVKKTAPYYPSMFGPQDAAFLVSEGFTVARIGFMWSAVEPEPGHFDDAYIEKIIALNTLLARYGIRTLIDFHQDDWGASTIYGDGAPLWASLGRSADQDFQAFWDNRSGPEGVGIQVSFIAAWQHVVSLIDANASASNILGFDPFNEPYPGSGYPSCSDFAPCAPFETGSLATFYQLVIDAIRSTGDTHLIFPEGVAQNATQVPSLPAFSDPQTAFNWHYYCPVSELVPDVTGLLTNLLCTKGDATDFSNIVTYTNRLGAPWIVSEFGANEADPEYAKEVDLFDSHFLTWMFWQYDGNFDPGDTPLEAIVNGSPGSEANANQQKLNALVVPYPQAIAGTPHTYSFERSTHTMTLTYSSAPAPGIRLTLGAMTQIFVPRRQYPNGYSVKVSGATVESSGSSTDLLLASTPGSHVVTVVVS
ncbi:MAG TPA: cellulase family glycosylhydrolase [Acidimicrobiales bacterium]|nr:cellulase family glycosylhydrolase [Acidimicrobiales bacterium]